MIRRRENVARVAQEALKDLPEDSPARGGHESQIKLSQERIAELTAQIEQLKGL